jgi:hypothetical protein
VLNVAVLAQKRCWNGHLQWFYNNEMGMSCGLSNVFRRLHVVRLGCLQLDQGAASTPVWRRCNNTSTVLLVLEKSTWAMHMGFFWARDIRVVLTLELQVNNTSCSTLSPASSNWQRYVCCVLLRQPPSSPEHVHTIVKVFFIIVSDICSC